VYRTARHGTRQWRVSLTERNGVLLPSITLQALVTHRKVHKHALSIPSLAFPLFRLASSYISFHTSSTNSTHSLIHSPLAHLCPCSLRSFRSHLQITTALPIIDNTTRHGSFPLCERFSHAHPARLQVLQSSWINRSTRRNNLIKTNSTCVTLQVTFRLLAPSPPTVTHHPLLRACLLPLKMSLALSRMPFFLLD
jgi:hypothetical protein